MPGISVTTSAPDEARDECARVYFPHRLAVMADTDRFRMSLSAVGLPTGSAGLLGYAGEVRIETGELATGYEVNVPLDGRLRTWTGHADVCASPARAAVYRPDGRATLHGWAGGGRLFGLKIERAALESTLAELIDRPVRGVVPLGPSLDLASTPGRQWWGLARSLVALVEDPDGPLAAPVVVRPLAQSVVAALLHVVEHPYRDALATRPAAPRPATVREAVDLLDAHPEVAWTVPDLAGRVGVGSRALQDGFARHVGTSPTAYLRQVRLARVHADLLAADPRRTSVTDVALRWGFTHLGRFAAAYRRRYGCAPSRTLTR
ncbi:transcriptional regulator, AraC family [Pseudonocardia dioxanivorans CB1190]|uniref:Transcriptional regulator, AraC family n=1 Tax=Pseudonocardia dioxanivorans (strain ATCC 55486 / DSM 44775 / JCM 13855 / CB1190) TaxID=675635 RepID=F4CYL7_PSEUX|nr:AraC family transcriptional regulator [Pseudonocardia dioxanivorans]AEA26587.1 transcriptional regulator, AraC family [Pseudonocardia dioxanivorans CB1190]